MKLFLSSCTHSQGRSTVARISTFVKGIKCCKCGAGCLISPCTVLIHLSPRSFAFLPWVVLEKRGAVGAVGVILVFRWSLSAMYSTWVRHMGRILLVWWSLTLKRGSEGSPVAVLRWTSSSENRVQMLLLHLKDSSVGERVPVERCPPPDPDCVRSPQKFMQGPWHANNLVVDD